MTAASPGFQPSPAPAVMRTAVIRAPLSAAVEMTPIPEPPPGQVRVWLEGCGVCGSNLPVWEGQPWFSYPYPLGAPGHEGWGIVDAVGDHVEDLPPGTRVACLSTHAFAEYDLAPADAVVPLPSALDDLAFPGEPLACAINLMARSGIVAGQTVAVVGVGFLGAMVVRLATARGARVVAISRRPFALEVARAQGAVATVALADADSTARAVSTVAGCSEFAVVVEAAGSQLSLDVASRLTATRGRLVVGGYHQDGPRQVDMQSWNWRGLDVINAHERDSRAYVDGLRAAVEAAAAGEWETSHLYTHTFALDELDRALTLLRERPDGFLKALVRT